MKMLLSAQIYLEIVAIGVVRVPKERRRCYAQICAALLDLLALPSKKNICINRTTDVQT